MKLNFCRVMRHMTYRYGDREAIVNVERGRRYSLRAYHLLTNRIANALRGRLGVGPGDRFALILENDNLALLHLPALLKQEGTAVMTNLRDSLEEHRRQVEFTQSKVAFVENRLLDSYLPMLQAAGCTVVAMDPLDEATPGLLDFWDLVEAASDADNEVALDQYAHSVMMRFTGGTTGLGKCAIYSPDTLMGCRDGAYIHPELGFDSSTRMLHVAPLSHGTQTMFHPTFFAGGANITMNALDLEGWMNVAEAERVTHSFLVPTALYRLLELQRARPRNLTSLRTVIYGAAPMSPAKLRDLLAKFGPIFVQCYGSTEAAMIVSLLGKSDHLAEGDAAAGRLSSAGRVTPGVEVFIADDHGNELPCGQVGEICIRCRSVAHGYYGNPEGTAAEFADDVWRSGDVGFLDAEGYLFIVDRRKDMIVSGGFNIYAAEVEAALAAHPAVVMSAVVGIPHEEWGEAVHAEVVLRAGTTTSPEELMGHVKARLGGYKAPKSVTFVAGLPLSAVGKVLRREVRAKYWQDRQRSVN